MKISAIICTKTEPEQQDLDLFHETISNWIGSPIESMELFSILIEPRRKFIRFIADFKSNLTLFDFLLKYNLQQETRMKIVFKLNAEQIKEFKEYSRERAILVKGFPLNYSYSSILNKLNKFGPVSFTNLGYLRGNGISGLVQYPNQRNMVLASSWLNGTLLQKHRILCKPAVNAKDFIPNSTRAILVNNLPDIPKFDLYELFLTFGQIESLELSSDGIAKVEYFNQRDALHLLSLNGKVFNGKELKLSLLTDQHRVYIENQLNIVELRNYFETIGPVKSIVEPLPNQFGYIEYHDTNHKMEALAKLNGSFFNNVKLQLSGSEPKHLMVHLGNLPKCYDECKLLEIFGQCGIIKNIKKSHNTAVLRFDSYQSVAEAFRICNYGMLKHKIIIKRFL